MRLAIFLLMGAAKTSLGKPIRLFSGTTMISWSIPAAKKSECFDLIIASTDEQEISEVTKATMANDGITIGQLFHGSAN